MAHTNKRTRTRTNTMQHKQDGRLSSLPDVILVEILSRLPIKLAVKTGVLSRRWRNLWTLISPLNLALEDTCFNKPLDMFPSIQKLVSQFASPSFSIQRCSLKLDDANSSISDDCIDACFKQICSRNIQEVDIHTKHNKDYKIWSLKLSPCIFQTRSLVTLNLVSSSYRCGFNMQRVNDIYLPMLKKLKVDQLLIYPGKWGIVENLLRSCPALEDLCLAIYSYEQTSSCVSLPGQNLKRMNLIVYHKAKDHGLVTIVIDAPKVEFLKINLDRGTGVSIVNSLTKLIKSELRIECSETEAFKLFGAVSNARSLNLNLISIPNKSDFAHIRFTQLTYLKLTNCHNSPRENLISFLQVCPALETLDLDLYACSFDESWVPADTPPLCFLTQLKRIEIKVDWNQLEKELLDLTKYLLSIGNNLDRLIFNSRRYNHDVEENLTVYSKEYPFCRELFSISSSQCQIEFHGITYFRQS